MLTKTFLLCLLCHLGHSATISSIGRTVNVNLQTMQEVTMDCEIQFASGENFFSKLVYWMKIQNMTVLETFTTQMLINGKLNNQDSTVSEELALAVEDLSEISILQQPKNPFDDKTKFDVTLDQDNNKVTLKIKQLTAQDSGLYICAVKNENNIASVDYTLNILQPVSNVMIMGSPEVTENMTMNLNMEDAYLIYHEKENGYFECKSEGGFPAPLLSVFIGEQRISGYGLNNVHTNYTLVGDLGGRQTISPIRWINSTTFRVTRQMNNKKIRCQAEVRTSNSTFHNVTEEKTLTVYYKPIIDCFDDKIKIPLGGAKISVKCEILARPLPEISWTAKQDNVKVVSNDITNNKLGLKAVTEVASTQDKMIATLNFDVVKREHFQKYDIVAQNVAGKTEFTVTIENGELRVDTTTGKASSLSAIILLTALAAALQLFITIS